MTPLKCIIVAMTKAGVIGKDNVLPWKIPSEIAYFRKITSGGTVVMGRNTFESIGKNLPGRENIVVTSKGVEKADVTVFSIKEALEVATRKRVFFIGGRKIYEEALQVADVMYVSVIQEDYEGNIFFPAIPTSWVLKMTVELEHFFVKKYVKGTAVPT
jgi:dihydrofolate reductase